MPGRPPPSAQVQAHGVADAVFWPTGLVVLTRQREVVCATNLEEPRPIRLADLPPEAGEPRCMAVVEPPPFASGEGAAADLVVLLAAGDSLWSITASGAADRGRRFGRVTQLAVAPNGLFVAAFSEDGHVRVVSADFAQTLTDFATRSAAAPDHVAWCGSDSVVLFWPEALLMVGPAGDWVKYAFDEAAALAQEPDGCRVLTRGRHELLRRVPDPLRAVFAIGSTAPSALLCDSLESFDRGSAKADEALRLVGPALLAAVEECISAAGHALDVGSQKQLLRAASYGAALCPLEARLPHAVFPGMCRTVRLLNALRAPQQGGMPLTYSQYCSLPPGQLLQRLVNGRRFLLAMRVAAFLGEAPHSVLLQWASVKMGASVALSDAALLEALMAKLASAPGLPFSAVAADAYRRGRPRLAALLLDFETRSSEQVPLLTTMGEDDRALVKAIESADTDLVYLAIFNLYRRLRTDFPAFATAVAAHKPARDLFVAYTRRTDPDLLKSFFFATGDAEGTADAVFSEAVYGPRDEGPLAPALAAKLLQQAGELHGKSTAKDAPFAAAAAGEASRLLKAQLELEAEAKAAGTYCGLTLADTIARCIAAGNGRAVASLRSDFKMSDRLFAWVRLRAYAAARDWDAVLALAEERKMPLGPLPFVETAFEGKAPKAELARLIARLPEASARVEWFTQAGLMQQAQQAATEASAASSSFTLQATATLRNAVARLGTGTGGAGPAG